MLFRGPTPPHLTMLVLAAPCWLPPMKTGQATRVSIKQSARSSNTDSPLKLPAYRHPRSTSFQRIICLNTFLNPSWQAWADLAFHQEQTLPSPLVETTYFIRIPVFLWGIGCRFFWRGKSKCYKLIAFSKKHTEETHPFILCDQNFS